MRRGTTRLAGLACAATVAVIGIAGCGGGDDAALSRDEFVTQANAICAAGNAKISAAVPTDGPPGQELYEAVVDETQHTIDGVAALEPPEDMASDVDAMIAAANEAMSQVRATPAAEFFAGTEDPFAAVDAKADELGLTECGTAEG